MYIQLSRSESFGISIAEAMYLGVPCAISEEINLAESFATHDLGLTLPPSTGFAAYQLTNALRSPATLVRWSERARQFGREQFDASAAVKRYVELYEEILSGPLSNSLQNDESMAETAV